MHLLRLTVLIILATTSAQCNHELNETELLKMRDKSMETFHFLNAMRVNHQNIEAKAEISISDLLNTESGREELKELARYFKELDAYKQFVNDVLSEKCKDHDPKNYYQEYFEDHQELLQNSFTTYLSLGKVQKWPRYYYNPQSGLSFLWESIGNQSDQIDDLGPEVPKFELVKDSMKKVHEPARYVMSEEKWIEETPTEYRSDEFYKLYHIIPLTLLVRFCEVFSATWDVLDKADQKVLSAPFRVLKAIDGMMQAVKVGTELLREDFDYDKLKQLHHEETDFEFYIMKHVLWAPGNLFYGFKNRVSEETFETGSEVIIGRRKFMKAYYLYNRMLDFMNRIKNTNLKQTAEYIKSDESLVTEMTEILVKFIEFGKGNDGSSTPYRSDWRQWEYNEVLYQWTLNSPKEYGRLLISLNVTKEPEKSKYSDNRVSLALMMDTHCETKRHEYDTHVSIEDEEYKELEDFYIRSIMTNKTDALVTLIELMNKNAKSIHLAGITNFLRDQTKNYFIGECGESNLICLKSKLLCNYDVRGNYVVKCDDSEELMNRDCAEKSIRIKKRRFVTTPSFHDWCNGRKFENKYQITTDSILVHALTFNTTKPNVINKKNFYDIYDAHQELAFEKFVDFLPFYKFQVMKFNTTANRILNEACKSYKKSFN